MRALQETGAGGPAGQRLLSAAAEGGARCPGGQGEGDAGTRRATTPPLLLGQ